MPKSRHRETVVGAGRLRKSSGLVVLGGFRRSDRPLEPCFVLMMLTNAVRISLPNRRLLRESRCQPAPPAMVMPRYAVPSAMALATSCRDFRGSISAVSVAAVAAWYVLTAASERPADLVERRERARCPETVGNAPEAHEDFPRGRWAAPTQAPFARGDSGFLLPSPPSGRSNSRSQRWQTRRPRSNLLDTPPPPSR